MLVTESPEALRAWLSQRHPEVELPEVAKIVAELDEREDRASVAVASALGYSDRDFRALWVDQQNYLRRQCDVTHTPRASTIVSARNRPAALPWRPYGNVLVCLPSNAPIPLAPILAVSGMLAGNRLVFTRPASTASIVEILFEPFAGSRQLALWTRSPRDLIKDELDLFDHVYFMGSSSAYPQLAFESARAGCGLHFEGQGNGFVLVSESATSELDEVARQIVRSKAFCNGRMCSAPNGVLVADSIFADLWEKLRAEAARVDLTDRLGALVASEAWHELAGRATLTCGSAAWQNLRNPVFASTSSPSDALAEEFFGPVAWIGNYSSFADCLTVLEKSPFRLQATYFGRDHSEAEALLETRFARYCFNMNPADQDPLLPWGNFAGSGYSRVQTFAEKFQEPVLVEGGL